VGSVLGVDLDDWLGAVLDEALDPVVLGPEVILRSCSRVEDKGMVLGHFRSSDGSLHRLCVLGEWLVAVVLEDRGPDLELSCRCGEAGGEPPASLTSSMVYPDPSSA